MKVKGYGYLGGQGTFWGLYLTGSVFGPKTVGSAGHCYKNKRVQVNIE